MFFGYSVHHANDVYIMLNLYAKRIIHSRDIIWLNKAYHDWIERKVSQKKETDDEDDDVIANSKIQEVKDGQDKLSSVQDQNELKKKKIYRAMRLLESSFNPEASTMPQNIEQGREILLEQANIALFRGILIDEEPSGFDEAWIHDDSKARENGEMPLKRSFVTWISNKFGRSLRKKIFQKVEELLNVNGSLR
jgi:hypothetical protein